jgi:hypothetical protein
MASNPAPAHLALILAVFAIVCAIRIVSPSDATTGNQPLQLAYIHDVVANGNWVVQHLPDGTPAAKPFVLPRDQLVIGSAMIIGASAVALWIGIARRSRWLIAVTLITALLAGTAIYQFEIPVTGDTRAWRVQ